MDAGASSLSVTSNDMLNAKINRRKVQQDKELMIQLGLFRGIVGIHLTQELQIFVWLLLNHLKLIHTLCFIVKLNLGLRKLLDL